MSESAEKHPVDARDEVALASKDSAQPTSETLRGPAGAESPKNTATITITEKAATAIQKQIAKRGLPDTALRLGIRGGGCSGFSYAIEFHDGPPRARDRVFDVPTEDGSTVRVVVDPKSLVYLAGMTLEWEQTLLRQGFKFLNPNEKTSCGCGHSFTV